MSTVLSQKQMICWKIFKKICNPQSGQLKVVILNWALKTSLSTVNY